MTIAPFRVENRYYTAEELFRFPSEARFELVRGRLHPMSPTGGAHGFVTADLMFEISGFARLNNLGRCAAAETGFLLVRDPDVVLAPDIAFISTARLVGLDLKAFLELVPELVVETRSPSDRRSEVGRKISRWLSYGVTVVIDADPEKRTLIVHRLDFDPVSLGIADILTLPDLLPGFVMPLTRIFSE